MLHGNEFRKIGGRRFLVDAGEVGFLLYEARHTHSTYLYRLASLSCSSADEKESHRISLRREMRLALRKHAAFRRVLSTSGIPAPAVKVGDFSKVRVDEASNGFRSTFVSQPIAAGEVIFSFSGIMHRHRGPMTLQCGALEHLGAASPDEPWLFMNHSFTPTARIEHGKRTDAGLVLTVFAIADMVSDQAVTFDYSLHEWETLDGGFMCHESGRTVSGWVGRTEEEKDRLLKSAAPHIRSLHLQQLFGSQSRC